MTDHADIVREQLRHLGPERGATGAAALDALVAERDEAQKAFRVVDQSLRTAVERMGAAEAERNSLMADSWRAFVESGGDPDGCLEWHCTPVQAGTTLIDAVRQLRSDYDDDSDLKAAEAECKRLQAELDECIR